MLGIQGLTLPCSAYMTGNLWEFPAERFRGSPSGTEYLMILRSEDRRPREQLGGYYQLQWTAARDCVEEWQCGQRRRQIKDPVIVLIQSV